MTLKKMRRTNFGGYRRSIWDLVTAFITLLMPVTSGYAQTVPAANAFAKHFHINFSQDALTDLKRRPAAARLPERRL